MTCNELQKSYILEILAAMQKLVPYLNLVHEIHMKLTPNTPAKKPLTSVLI